MKRISGLIFSICVLLYQALGLAQNKFLLGYSSFSSNQTPLWVAKEEGLFKRYGSDPDLILIEGAHAAPKR